MNTKASPDARSWLDWFGVAVASGCAVHCLLLPLWPLIGMALLADPAVERGALIASALLATVAIGHGACARHRRVFPVIVMVAGFALYLGKDAMGETAEPFLLAVGAALVSCAHLMNLRCHRAGTTQ
ncbi:MerC domain-containing protein [Algiphilus sp.]|uniref:MerC domain-containing protein n=1 Tax=Algiphilus sp. TaxID=1872431 RepID=UPI003C623A43